MLAFSQKERIAFYYAAIILFALMMADVGTTTIALQNSGVHEANILMAKVVNNLGLFVAVKSIGALVIILLMRYCLLRDRTWGKMGIGIILTMYSLIVLNNLYWMVAR